MEIKQYTWDGVNDIVIRANAIYSLGVSGIAGTKLYINDNNKPLIIGSTGIFSMDFNDVEGITSIALEKDELKGLYYDKTGKQVGTPLIDVAGVEFTNDSTGPFDEEEVE